MSGIGSLMHPSTWLMNSGRGVFVHQGERLVDLTADKTLEK